MGVTRLNLPEIVEFPGYIAATTGGKILYVDSGGVRDGTTSFVAERLSTTLNAALSDARANRGDVVIVLPGHAETITGTDVFSNMKAGVRVVGIGQGNERPTFTFDGTAGTQVALNDANVTLENLIFANCATADTTLAVDVSAAYNTLRDVLINASDASQKMTRVLRLSSGANDFKAERVNIYGGATALTDTCLVNAAVARPRWRECHFAAALATTQGLITFATAAATRIRIQDCVFENAVASSTVALKGIASLTGTVINTYLGITVADAGGVGTAAFNTPGNVTVFNTGGAATITKSNITAVAATTA